MTEKPTAPDTSETESELSDGYFKKCISYRRRQVAALAIGELITGALYFGYCEAFGHPEKCYAVPPVPKEEDLWAVVESMTKPVAVIEILGSMCLLSLVLHGPRKVLFVFYVLINTFCTVYFPLWHLSCSSRLFSFFDLSAAILSVIFRQLLLTATVRLYCLQTNKTQEFLRRMLKGSTTISVGGKAKDKTKNGKKILKLLDFGSFFCRIKTASFTFKNASDYKPMKLKVSTSPGNTYTVIEIICEDEIKTQENDYKIPLTEEEKKAYFFGDGELPPKPDTVDQDLLMSETDSVSDDSDNEEEK